MKQKKMSILGIGPLLAMYTFCYAMLMWIVTKYLEKIVIIKHIPNYIFYVIGGLLLIIGIPFFIISVKTLLKGFPQSTLMTNGVYGISRNPLYSSFICFIVPGIVILTKSVLMMTIPIFMYFTFKLLIKKEEDYLGQTFGQEYLDYKSRVNLVLPMFKTK
jgi:protein-S-isoprenylcysteine O-methyltransferase Ste14